MAYFYLINDVLYNSINTKIKYSWIYKILLQNLLPKLLHDLFYKNEILLNNKMFINKLNEIFTIWKEKFNLFENNYYNGLFYYLNDYDFKMFSKEILNDENIIKEINNFEEDLFNLYNKDAEKLKEIAKENGFYENENYGEIINKFINIKKFHLYSDYVQEINGEDCVEEILDLKIEKLKNVLNTMKNTYNKINILDENGIEIHPIEYEFFGIKNENIQENKQNEINNNNIINEEYESDIDGEPI